MKNKLLLLVSILLVSVQISWSQATTKRDYTRYVNPFIGTGSVDSLSLSGSNFPGATYPFGLVQLSPDTDDNPEDPCSGYDYADDLIVGFSHTHLSGTGVADLFDFLFMPFKGELTWNPMSENGEKAYSSHFSHENEVASPGYYSVLLDEANTRVELTATEHCGMHKYTSRDKEPLNLMIDMDHSLDKSRPYWTCKIIDAQIRVIDNKTIEGYRTITGWANQRRVYFRAEFSRPFTKQYLKAGARVYENQPVANHTNLKMIATFDGNTDQPVVVRVGLSSVSYEGARENLKSEINHFDFEKTYASTKEAWNKELSVIDMEGTPSQKTIFYTSLYHMFIQPNNIADVNGNYLNSTSELQNAPDKKHYSTFSLWDTYRAAHPLYTIIQQKRTGGFINSMLRQYKDYGYLPIWQLWGKETYCMIGNHAIPVIVDAYMKGIEGFDKSLAWEAVKASSSIPHQHAAFNLLNEYKYIPENKQSQSVSIGLEVAFNDWCTARMAEKMGKKDDYSFFSNRAGYYKNLFDPSIGFFRAKDDKGAWIEPFSPLKYGGNGGYPFTEGNGWQYLWYVPQDVYGFIDLMGGDQAFINKLDEFFTLDAKPGDVNGNASGFIGQYAHGNEPSHHIAYLYNFTSQPWKAQYYTAKVMHEQYTDQPSGYSGNEDCGQMSAWYIFSSMGFYPVNPALDVYSFGSPQLPRTTINLENGKQFTVITKNASAENIYIQNIKLNGKPYTKNYITHADIINGGELEFTMGKKPNQKISKYDKPV